MSTLQPVNLPRSNPPAVSEVKETGPDAAMEGETKVEQTGSPAGSEDIAVDKGSSGSSEEDSQPTKVEEVPVPVLGPVVGVSEEETK